MGSSITPEVHVNTVASCTGEFSVRTKREGNLFDGVFKIWTKLSIFRILNFLLLSSEYTFESLINVQKLVPRILVLFEYAMKSGKSS